MPISIIQSRRRFLKHTGIGLLTFASMPNWLNAAVGMHWNACSATKAGIGKF